MYFVNEQGKYYIVSTGLNIVRVYIQLLSKPRPNRELNEKSHLGFAQCSISKIMQFLLDEIQKDTVLFVLMYRAKWIKF